jgi:bromodomain and WD repeat domain-containing protein 1/3
MVHADEYILASVSDFTIKVFNSRTGDLLHTMTGHVNHVFVLEPCPTRPDVAITTGHDGKVQSFAFCAVCQGMVLSL